MRFSSRAYPLFIAAVVLLQPRAATHADSPALPIIDGVSAKNLADQARNLVEALDRLHAPLGSNTVAELKTLAQRAAAGKDDASRGIQEILDPLCLIAVSINPESRVKAARGPAAAALESGHEKLFLAKVVNEAGVTHALELRSPQFGGRAPKTADHWLEGRVVHDKPLRQTLSGEKVEYVVLGFSAQQAGKREAVLKFDVGQGTQDLGFRAEVPVLFHIRVAKPR